MSTLIFSLLDTPAYGGAEEYLLDVLTHLLQSGYPVILATNNAQVRSRAPVGLTVVKLPYRLDAIGNWKGLVKYFLGIIPALYWLFITLRTLQKKIQGEKREGKVVCIFPGFTDRLSFSPLVRFLGCRLIWLEYGPLEPTFERNHGFPKFLYALGRPFPEKVVTISEWTKKSLIGLGKIPAEKIQIIYPGIQKIEARNQGRGKGKHINVVTVARLATEKEIDLLLYAWGSIDLANKKLIIVGDGPERESLERLTLSLNIQATVEFAGFVSDQRKLEILQRADLFVFPSAWNLEGFGMTSAEAMAVGLPTVSSGYGPQAEIVIDGMTGWTFTPHDPQSLAAVLRHALADPERAKRARQGRAWVRNSFSRERAHAAWLSVVQSGQNERYR